MNPTISVDNSALVVPLDSAKQHCRSFSASDDPFVTDFIKLATEVVEDMTQRCCLNRTYVWKAPRFVSGARGPTDDFWYARYPFGDRPDPVLYLPIAPVVSISSVTYVNTAGSITTVSPTTYVLDNASEPCRLGPTVNWPTDLSTSELMPVTVTFVAGYDASDPTKVPFRLREAIKRLVAHYYENRGFFSEDPGMTLELPLGFVELISSLKVFRYA